MVFVLFLLLPQPRKIRPKDLWTAQHSDLKLFIMMCGMSDSFCYCLNSARPFVMPINSSQFFVYWHFLYFHTKRIFVFFFVCIEKKSEHVNVCVHKKTAPRRRSWNNLNCKVVDEFCNSKCEQKHLVAEGTCHHIWPNTLAHNRTCGHSAKYRCGVQYLTPVLLWGEWRSFKVCCRILTL